MARETYRVNEMAIAWIALMRCGFLGRRLLHALFCAGWQIEARQIQPNQLGQYAINVQALRETLLPSGETDTRQLQKAINGVAVTQLFDHCALSRSRRQIEVQFSDAIPLFRIDPGDAYATFDTALMAQCKTEAEFLFIEQVMLNHRKSYPKFQLPGLHRHPARDAKWAKIGHKWVRAICAVSRITGFRFVLGVSVERYTGRIMDIAVKIEHGSTKWSVKNLYSFGDFATVTEIWDGNAKKLKTSDIKAKLAIQ